MALILERADVEAALPMSECIAAQEEAFRQYALGTAIVPERLGIDVSEHAGLYLAMPAYLAEFPTDAHVGAMATKVVTFYPDNPARGLPSVGATVLLHDPRTGELLAIMDGAAITALRTAAGSAVATKYLARDDASIVGILGAGVQAESHLLAMCEVRDVAEARVYSRTRAQREAFAVQMAARTGVRVVAVEDARHVVEGADIVITATTAREPIVEGAWFDDGVHINCVGSGIPDRRELDDDIVLRSKIVVDTRESALAEGGDLLIPIENGLMTADEIHADLGEVVAGQRVGRVDAREITLFKSVGVALQDVAAAARAYGRARSLGVGQVVRV